MVTVRPERETVRPPNGGRYPPDSLPGCQVLGTEPLAPPGGFASQPVRDQRTSEVIGGTGIGLTDLNRTGRMGLRRRETAYELGEPITQDFRVRIATTQHQAGPLRGLFVVMVNRQATDRSDITGDWSVVPLE